MSAWRELQESFALFERTQDQIVINGTAVDAGWRQRLINLRGQLHTTLTKMRSALRACELAGADPSACSDFARALSEMRTVLALHQAQWPAAAINLADIGYQRSVHDLRHNSSQFRRNARDLIKKLNI